jgi:hypothetical protein
MMVERVAEVFSEILRYLPPRVLLQIEVEQLVLELQRLADELHVAAPANANTTAARPDSAVFGRPGCERRPPPTRKASKAICGREEKGAYTEGRGRLDYGICGSSKQDNETGSLKQN